MSEQTGACPRPMTEMERRACSLIAPWLIWYPPGTAHRRMAGILGSAACRPRPTITPSQVVGLWELVRRYRDQVADPAVVAEADRQASGGEPKP